MGGGGGGAYNLAGFIMRSLRHGPTNGGADYSTGDIPLKLFPATDTSDLKLSLFRD